MLANFQIIYWGSNNKENLQKEKSLVFVVAARAKKSLLVAFIEK